MLFKKVVDGFASTIANGGYGAGVRRDDVGGGIRAAFISQRTIVTRITEGLLHQAILQ
jgi:hypothetical protein